MTNPSAFNQAWQEFHKVNAECFQPEIGYGAGKYLYNRLWLAFEAGFHAGMAAGKAELAEKLVAAIEKERG